MKKIKVLFIISNLPQGGAENQFIQLIKGIDKKKFDVSVVLYAYQKEAFFRNIFLIPEISILTNKLRHSFFIFKIIEAIHYINNLLNNNSFDIIYTSLFMNGLLLRMAAPKKYKNKIIAGMRTSINYYPKIYRIFEKFLIKNSFLIFNSISALKGFKTIIKKKYHNRLFVVYNGFSFETRISIPKKTESNTLFIGGLGRQSSQKNFIQLARVFNKINNDNIKLILQGDAHDETEKIKSELDTGLKTFEIRKPDIDIDNFFEEINILVIPSHYEGCPNVLFESMIRKTICIISDGANSDDFISDGYSGFVYDSSDKDLLSTLKSVISIIGTKDEKMIVNNAFDYVSKNFGMDVMVNKYEAIFKRIYEKN